MDHFDMDGECVGDCHDSDTDCNECGCSAGCCDDCGKCTGDCEDKDVECADCRCPEDCCDDCSEGESVSSEERVEAIAKKLNLSFP